MRPMDEEGKAVVPKLYRSSGELIWGRRVVVEYGDELWLFVVPPDGFLRQNDKKGEGEPRYEPSEITEWSPVRIPGVQFGKIPGLVDIAVDATGGDLTVWAFSIDGMAYVWQLGGRSKPIIKRIIQRDSTVTSAEDANGDTLIHYISPSSPTTRRAVQIDSSISRSLSVRPTPLPTYGAQDHIVEKDGDVAISDAPQDDKDEGYPLATTSSSRQEAHSLSMLHRARAAGAKRARTVCLVIWLRMATRSRMKGWVLNCWRWRSVRSWCGDYRRWWRLDGHLMGDIGDKW